MALRRGMMALLRMSVAPIIFGAISSTYDAGFSPLNFRAMPRTTLETLTKR